MNKWFQVYLKIKISIINIALEKPMSEEMMDQLIDQSHRYQDILQEYEKFLSTLKKDTFNF